MIFHLGALGEIPAGAAFAAKRGELVNLTSPAIVYYTPSSIQPALIPSASRVFAPGGTRCNAANFGIDARYDGSQVCYAEPLLSGVTGTVPPSLRPRVGSKVADDGKPFQLNETVTIFRGPQDARSRGVIGFNNVGKGTYTCDNATFGGSPGPCWAVPLLAPEVPAPTTYYQRQAAEADAEERAQTAVQAQRNLYEAQLAIQTQQADAQEQLAQLARDAQSQQAAALRAAETYRAIQDQAKAQAEAMAVELAKIAAANEADAMRARQAAELAAQSESIRQATETAHATEEDRARATLAAQAAALEAMRAQEEYEARLASGQAGAGIQAELSTPGGGGGLDLRKILLFGGLGLAAVLVMTSMRE